MSHSALDSFSNVIPAKDLLRGRASWALTLAVLADFIFVGILLVAFLVVGLLHNEGRVYLATNDVAAYEDLSGQTPIKSDEATPPRPAGIRSNEGLFAVAWDLRGHWTSSAVASLAQTWGGFHQTGPALFIFISLFLALSFAYSALVERVSIYSHEAAGRYATQLRTSLHRHALRMGTSDLLHRSTDDAVTLFRTDSETVRTNIARWIEGISLSPLRLLLICGILLALDWKLTFECVVPVVACAYLVVRDHRHTRKVERLGTDRLQQELDYAIEGVRHSRLVRGYALDEFEHARFETHLQRADAHATAVQRRRTRQKWLIRTLVLACLAFTVSLVALRLLSPAGEAGHLSLAEASLFVACFGAAWRPIRVLGLLRDVRAEATSAIDRIYRYLNAIPEVGQAVGAKFLQPLQKAVQFEDVSYRLNQKLILDHLNLKFPANTSTAIIAFDEFEAKALAAMLPRFIEPSEGKILFDGEDIAWGTLDSLRAETLYVGGEQPYLTGTVLENVGGGSGKYSLTQITEAAKEAHAHNFIQKLPAGYETLLGHHGEQLDAGQAFRLALARAILRDPALLIIKEPSGDISDADKSLIDDACRRAAKDRTVVFLPRRLPTLKHVDRIVLLNRGKVEVVGPHDVLMQTSQIYRHWEYINFNEFRHETSNPDRSWA